SRRRHTRFSRDWSSDVCSSDLLLRRHIEALQVFQGQVNAPAPGVFAHVANDVGELKGQAQSVCIGGGCLEVLTEDARRYLAHHEIGRASCRERGWEREGAGRLD